MIYTVRIVAPAIDEIITTEADDEQQAKDRAVYSALQRQAEIATVTVTPQEGPQEEDGYPGSLTPPKRGAP